MVPKHFNLMGGTREKENELIVIMYHVACFGYTGYDNIIATSDTLQTLRAADLSPSLRLGKWFLIP